MWFFLFLVAFACFIYFFVTKDTRHGGEDKGGGWGRRRWKPRPQGPGPLPSGWKPPDFIPEWVIQEQIGTIWIKPRKPKEPVEVGPPQA